jgi:hypothetical protein
MNSTMLFVRGSSPRKPMTSPQPHHLLQIRTRVLNDEWRTTMARWNPGMIAAA